MNDTVKGFINPSIQQEKFSSIDFIVRQALSQLNTVTLVRIVSCTNNGGVSPVGYVDVQPMVSQVSADGKSMDYPVIYNVPYLRMQGGLSAIILDPKAGDIGLCCFASRDISSIKITKKQAPPNSNRGYNISDALYVGGMLNGAPNQYVRFKDNGIEIISPETVTITAPSIKSNGAFEHTGTMKVIGATTLQGTLAQTGGGTSTVSGTFNASGAITSNGISLHTHKHSGVTTGGGQTGNPV